jgi:hypothetical protein
MLHHKQSFVRVSIFWAREDGIINMAQIKYMNGIEGAILENGE